MKNIKRFAATLTLAGIIMMGVSNTRAGLLMSDFAGGDEGQPCTTTVQVDTGVIVHGFVGVIVHGFVGVIVHGFTSDTCTNSDSLTGLLMSD